MPLAPDLVGEVISPNDTFSEVEDKALSWLAAGTRLVLLLDPGTQTLHVYRATDKILVLDDSAEFDAEGVLPAGVSRSRICFGSRRAETGILLFV